MEEPVQDSTVSSTTKTTILSVSHPPNVVLKINVSYSKEVNEPLNI